MIRILHSLNVFYLFGAKARETALLLPLPGKLSGGLLGNGREQIVVISILRISNTDKEAAI